MEHIECNTWRLWRLPDGGAIPPCHHHAKLRFVAGIRRFASWPVIYGTRKQSLEKMLRASLKEFRIRGVKTNIASLTQRPQSPNSSLVMYNVNLTTTILELLTSLSPRTAWARSFLKYMMLGMNICSGYADS